MEHEHPPTAKGSVKWRRPLGKLSNSPSERYIHFPPSRITLKGQESTLTQKLGTSQLRRSQEPRGWPDSKTADEWKRKM